MHACENSGSFRYNFDSEETYSNDNQELLSEMVCWGPFH